MLTGAQGNVVPMPTHEVTFLGLYQQSNHTGAGPRRAALPAARR